MNLLSQFAMLLLWMLLFTFVNTVQSECGYPGAPAHSILSFSSDDIGPGSVATYECEGGFELLGPVRRTCEENNTWTPPAIPFCVLNVAAGKAPMQSSVNQGGFPQKAVDGSTSAFYSDSTCTQTTLERTPWWYVNLLEPYMIQLVRIDFGRPCCPDNQPANIIVRVGNNRPDLGVNPICGRYTGMIEEGKPLFIPCTPPLPGAFVSIHMETPRGGILSICEAFVYTDQALPIESCPSFRDQPLGSTATFNGKCYIFYNNQPLTFDNARRLCQSRGGSLVDEASPPLQGFISWELWRRHRNNPNGQYWMGAIRDPRDPNNWKWINGQDVSVSYWNLPGGNDNCSRYDGTKGWLWSDTDCNLNLNYICQNRPIRCGIPERPPNSTILTTADDFNSGTIVEYHCSAGHLLIGNSARTCLQNGFYTESPPTCKYLECGMPVEISNGQFTLLNGTRYYESIVRYDCKEGHILMGEQFLMCDVQQTWNGPPPRCEPTRCPQPSPLANGSYRLLSNATTFGTVLEYVCNHPGYRLSGTSRLRCGTDGHWDNEPPTCTEVPNGGRDSVVVGVSSGAGSRPPSETSSQNPKSTTTQSSVVTKTTVRTTTTNSNTKPPSPSLPPKITTPSKSITVIPFTFGERLDNVEGVNANVADNKPEVVDTSFTSDEAKPSATPAHFIRPYFPEPSVNDKIDTNINLDPHLTVTSSTTQQTTLASKPPTVPSPTHDTEIIFPDESPSTFAVHPTFSKPTTQERPVEVSTRPKPRPSSLPPSTTHSTIMTQTTTTTTPLPTTTTTTVKSTTTEHTTTTMRPSTDGRPSPFIPRPKPTADHNIPSIVTAEETFNPFQNPSLIPATIGQPILPPQPPPPQQPSSPDLDLSANTVSGTIKDESPIATGSRPELPNKSVAGSSSSSDKGGSVTKPPKVNGPESEVQEEDVRSNTKLNLGGIIALSVFGGFVVLAAFITILVIFCRRSRRSAGSLDNTTISTDDSLSSESRGLNKYYKRAWENLRNDSKSNGGLGPNLHRLGVCDSDKHTGLSRQETMDNPNYRGTGTIEGLRDTNEMTVNDATAWNTRTDRKDRRPHNGHHHHHHHHHHRRSGSPDSIDGHDNNINSTSPWQNKHRRH